MASKNSPLRAAASRGPAIKTLTTTRAYTFSNYSKAPAHLRPGEALRSKPFDFHSRSWRIKLYPAGFSPATRDFVAIFVKCRTEPFCFYNTGVTIEILDRRGESAVFDNATAKTRALARSDGEFSRGYVEFARRRELEAASCV
ncbi:BTB/POZ and MATH domain-containing protein 1-like [Panicum miliaceum]|uniref:BTB/POZ and MATH domain-containing protein 1-like n=1 Tax=Panicum miliaceum TaxID=4540 RepID=A0A3L6QAI3_PANMI|nr:BTB/POZ and MATH domain-containing protein 1-like [Panicum miliaceum]